MKIVWTESARQDLRQVIEYIAEDNRKAEGKLLLVIKNALFYSKTIPSWAKWVASTERGN